MPQQALQYPLLASLPGAPLQQQNTLSATAATQHTQHHCSNTTHFAASADTNTFSYTVPSILHSQLHNTDTYTFSCTEVELYLEPLCLKARRTFRYCTARRRLRAALRTSHPQPPTQLGIPILATRQPPHPLRDVQGLPSPLKHQRSERDGQAEGDAVSKLVSIAPDCDAVKQRVGQRVTQ